jgi:HD-GYP domain-containing protein (c-di-GMP phosphodiesterase class II)
MEASNATIVAGALLDRFERIGAALATAFGSPFEQMSQHQTPAGVEEYCTARGRLLGIGEAIAIPEGSGSLLVCLCLHAEAACRRFAVAHCPGTDGALAERLAHYVYASVLQTEQLEEARGASMAYVSQLTHDFEELCWLRSLSQGLEYCHANGEMASVSQSVLPTLRQLIHAETLAVIPATDRPTDAADDVVLPAYQCGSMLIDEQLASLVRRFAGDCLDHPLIHNRPLPDEGPSPRVKSCMVAAIRHHDRDFGYLVAVNRLMQAPDDADATHGFEANSLTEEREFGTIEGTLLGAAAAMLGTHASNMQLFRDKEQLLIGVIRALINAIDAKDSYTCGHSDRVALIARRIAAEVGLDARDRERVYMAGLLHDIGKIGIPDGVLTKAGKLTEEEFDTIKLHPTIGYTILRHLKQLEFVLPGVLHHHEMVNGRGYPHALVGEQIPLIGRVLAVADAYDAMTSSRPYRQALPSEKAEQILRDGAGTQWDEQIVAAFFAALGDIKRICSRADEHTASILAGGDKGPIEKADALSAAVAAMNVAG